VPPLPLAGEGRGEGLARRLRFAHTMPRDIIPTTPQAAANRTALDGLSFALADVKDGIGPFLAVFLTASEHWDPGRAGLVLTVGGLATVLARAPAGALVDVVRHKRTLIAAACLVVAAAAALMAALPRTGAVLVGQVANGAADAVLPAAVAAISLGIVGRAGFARRVGRNEAFNHAGNVLTAILAGLAGALIAPGAVLWLVAALAFAALVPLALVRGAAIDHAVARGGDRPGAPPGGLRALPGLRPFLAFTAAITLFHFANAAMLPLLGEKLAAGHAATGPAFIAACIVTAQAAMVPMAILVGRRADAWGRKPLFLVAFAVLPVRGVLYTLVQGPEALVAIQLLDGVAAGIFGALFPVVIADLTAGSGRFNFAQGVSAAAWGVGAALSNTLAGYVVNGFGYDAAFLLLAAIAAGALVVFWASVPETRDWPAGAAAAARAEAVPAGEG
jgi:MFS family permease